jgi:hypothetical protein
MVEEIKQLESALVAPQGCRGRPLRLQVVVSVEKLEVQILCMILSTQANMSLQRLHRYSVKNH